MRAVSHGPLLRALVVGAGYMGRRHLDAYARHPGATVVGAVSRSEASAALVAGDYGLPTFTDVDEALARTSPDVVSVCSPTDRHLAHGRAALAAGAHVLVEKPLAPTLDEARALVRAATDAGRTLMPAHTTLFEPATYALVRLATEGALGPLRRISFVRRGLDLSPGELEKARGPGGALAADEEDRGWLYDHLVHVTYLLNRLAAATPVEVEVAERRAARFRETLRARVTFRNGVTAALTITSEPEDAFAKQLDVEGRRGAARWRMALGRSAAEARAGAGDWQPLRVAPGSAFDGVVHHFVDAVLAGRAPMEQGRDGLRAMALAAALAGGFP